MPLPPGLPDCLTQQSIDCVVINAANADTYTLFALE
jgi:hypothetical protein